GFSITNITKGFLVRFRGRWFGVASAVTVAPGEFSPGCRTGRIVLPARSVGRRQRFLIGDKYADSLFFVRGWSIRIGASSDRGFRGLDERAQKDLIHASRQGLLRLGRDRGFRAPRPDADHRLGEYRPRRHDQCGLQDYGSQRT